MMRAVSPFQMPDAHAVAEQMLEQEIGAGTGDFDVVVAGRRRAGLGESADGERIPRGDHLAVAIGCLQTHATQSAGGIPRPASEAVSASTRIERATCASGYGIDNTVVPCSKLPPSATPNTRAAERAVVGAERITQLGWRPHEERAFATRAVRVLRCRERPTRQLAARAPCSRACACRPRACRRVR